MIIVVIVVLVIAIGVTIALIVVREKNNKKKAQREKDAKYKEQQQTERATTERDNQIMTQQDERRKQQSVQSAQQNQIVQETSPRNNSLRRRQDEPELPARDPSPRKSVAGVPEEGNDDSVGADAPQKKEIDQKPGPSASQVGFNNQRSGVNQGVPFSRDLNKGRPDSKVMQQVAPNAASSRPQANNDDDDLL